MKKIGKLKCTLLSEKKSICNGDILRGLNCMTFWKMQNSGVLLSWQDPWLPADSEEEGRNGWNTEDFRVKYSS